MFYVFICLLLLNNAYHISTEYVLVKIRARMRKLTFVQVVIYLYATHRLVHVEENAEAQIMLETASATMTTIIVAVIGTKVLHATAACTKNKIIFYFHS